MTKLGFESSIKFLNNILNFGKEYEELGCSPSTIPGIICNINYETRKIWLRPSETNYLNKKLSKLLNKWKVKNIKPLKEYEIDNKNIYIYWKINDEIGRCFIIKRINKQPLIHYIDNGKIEEMSNEIKIFKIDNDMICGDLAYPLCFVLEYLPSVYCEKYDIPKISNFEIEDFIHVFIINCPGDYVYGFGTSSKNTLSLIENNFIKNYEIGKKLGKVKYLCKGNDTYVSSKSTIFQFYEIIEEYADCFVIGVPDEKHIYVRSINLSIGYLFFFQYLNKFYRKEKSRKELNVNKIDIKNYREIYVFYDSSTDNFYRVSIINYNNDKVNCFCIDQPTLVFSNISNEPDFFWRLVDFFKFPRFLSLVKMGSFQDSNIFLHFKMVSGSKANELKEILKSNNIVQVIKDSCKKFNLVKHEGKDLIEKYKVKINENLDENINTSFIDKPKDFKNFNFGEFGKSLNASFCKNGNILGKSLKDECLRKSKSNVYNTCDTEKEIDFDSFGMVNYTRDSNDVSNYSFYNLYPCREEKGDVDVLIEELNKINKNDTFSNHFDSTIDLPPNGNTNLIKKEMINFVITNFINENEIYILCNEELELYLKNYDIIKKYDIKKLKEIKIEDVLPFNIYLIDYEGERYIVRLDINFLDIDRKIFLNNETKLSFEYNKKMKIYEYPHEILLLPNINSKKVSLSKSFCDYYQHLDIYDKKTAIDYLKSMIPPFKKFINILGMIEIGNANNKQILNMSILDGDNISEKFQRYCRELYSKEKNNFTKN